MAKHFYFEILCIDNYFGMKTSRFVILAGMCFWTVFGSHVWFFQYICVTIYQCHNFVGIFKNIYSGCQVGNMTSSIQAFFMIAFYTSRVSEKSKGWVFISELWAFGNIGIQITDLGRTPRVPYRFTVFRNPFTRSCFIIFAFT